MNNTYTNTYTTHLAHSEKPVFAALFKQRSNRSGITNKALKRPVYANHAYTKTYTNLSKTGGYAGFTVCSELIHNTAYIEKFNKAHPNTSTTTINTKFCLLHSRITYLHIALHNYISIHNKYTNSYTTLISKSCVLAPQQAGYQHSRKPP